MGEETSEDSRFHVRCFVLGDVTEVPLPLKFLFLLIGPSMEDYMEIGRSLSTLFSTLVGHRVDARVTHTAPCLRRTSERQRIRRWIVGIC